jgi:hypothetical protein
MGTQGSARWRQYISLRRPSIRHRTRPGHRAGRRQEDGSRDHRGGRGRRHQGDSPVFPTLDTAHRENSARATRSSTRGRKSLDTETVRVLSRLLGPQELQNHRPSRGHQLRRAPFLQLMRPPTPGWPTKQRSDGARARRVSLNPWCTSTDRDRAAAAHAAVSHLPLIGWASRCRCLRT